LNKIK